MRYYTLPNKVCIAARPQKSQAKTSVLPGFFITPRQKCSDGTGQGSQVWQNPAIKGQTDCSHTATRNAPVSANYSHSQGFWKEDEKGLSTWQPYTNILRKHFTFVTELPRPTREMKSCYFFRIKSTLCLQKMTRDETLTQRPGQYYIFWVKLHFISIAISKCLSLLLNKCLKTPGHKTV